MNCQILIGQIDVPESSPQHSLDSFTCFERTSWPNLSHAGCDYKLDLFKGQADCDGQGLGPNPHDLSWLLGCVRPCSGCKVDLDHGIPMFNYADIQILAAGPLDETWPAFFVPKDHLSMRSNPPRQDNFVRSFFFSRWLNIGFFTFP